MSAFTDSLQLVRTKRFGTFCLAAFLSNLGTWAQQVAEPWLLLNLGASSFVIGLDSFVMAAPVWVLTLVGGVLADRSDRRLVIARCQSLQMMCPVLLVVLLLTGTVRPWMVIILSTVVGVTDALSMPSFQSIVPSIVEHDQIAPALALNATQFNLSRVLGPAVAGVMMVTVGAVGCFAMNAVSYLPFIWVALWILLRGRPPLAVGDSSDGDSFLTAVRDIIRSPGPRGALLTVLSMSTLCGPFIAFCPVLVRDVHNGDIGQFSLSIAAFGVGGVFGAVTLSGVDTGRDRRRISSWLARFYGVVLVAAAFNPWSWGLPALLAFVGMAMTVSNTAANSLLQATSLPGLRVAQRSACICSPCVVVFQWEAWRRAYP